VRRRVQLRGGGDGEGGEGRRGSHRDSYLLLSLFSLFSSPPPSADAAVAAFLRSLARSVGSLLVLLFRARLAARIPSPGCDSANGLSAPRTAVYFYCNVPLPPIPPSLPRAQTLYARSLSLSLFLSLSLEPSREFFLAALLSRNVLSILLSFFLPVLLSTTPALTVVSNLAKGWRRECAPRARSRASSFCYHRQHRRRHPRLPAAVSPPSYQFCSFLFFRPFFLHSFFPLSRERERSHCRAIRAGYLQS